MKVFGIALVALLTCSCGGKSPPELCDEMAGAFSATFARCGFDGAQAREGFLESAVGGSCQNVIEIKDDSSLEGECIPWFRSVGCDVVKSADFASALPPSCKGQLETK